MCGVVGFVQSEGFAANEAAMIAGNMARALSHRGPDDSGYWVDGHLGIALAHRRLSIVDLSAAGHQPMTSHSGRYIISFNGEVYNHCELRNDLHRRYSSLQWKGRSDTETLLQAIELLGIRKALENAVGMFAFALWDRAEHTLHLARDRIGEKPLYFGWQGGVFMFASELKALTRHPSFVGDIDMEAVRLFLRYGYVPCPRSIYSDIWKLPPASYMKLNAGRRIPPTRGLPNIEAYWSLQDAIDEGLDNPFNGTPEDAVDELQMLIGEAVRLQLQADVPLGAFLSGGIDSSTIVALMQAYASSTIRTFTVGFGEAHHNEAFHAKSVSKHLSTCHTEVVVSARDALDIIPRMPELYDEPFSDSSQIPTFLVSETTRRHVTVALSGDGGDELFGGYARYSRTPAIWRYISSTPKSFRRFFSARSTVARPNWVTDSVVGRKIQAFSELCNFPTVESLYVHQVSHWKDPASVVRDVNVVPINSYEPAGWPVAESIETQLMALDALTYLPDDILVKVDRAAMSVGLETRAPFLDHRVVEFAYRLPLSVKIRGKTGKWILRQLLYKYVPRELVDRPKMGFSVPLADWLRGPLRDWAESLLSVDRLRSDGFFCPDAIRRRWMEHITGRREWHRCLWDIIMFQAWLDHRDAP